jgi:DNA-binding response OmpR family regulator
MNVLFVGADLPLADTVRASLQGRGYQLHYVPSAAAAISAPPHDLVLIDLSLPDADALRVCRRLYERGDVAIIVLAERGTELAGVACLRNGADDCLVKPFGAAELQARMEAVLRRARPRPAGTLTVGSLRVDLDQHQVSANGTPLALTPKEFQLLVLLAREPGVVVDRERLMSQVWRTTWRGTSRTLDVHMATLRAKLLATARVDTIRGVGYRITPAGS